MAPSPAPPTDGPPDMAELDALRRDRRLLTNILESSSAISIVATDLDRNIVYWNRGAENLFGYSAAETVGKMKIDVLYPDEAAVETVVAEIRSFVCGTRTQAACELQERHRDGSRVWVHLTLTPRLDEHGAVIGILGIGQDVTERRQAEAERETLQRQLTEALTRVLRGFIPICAACRRIRKDDGRWIPLEAYVERHSDASFTHGCCSECCRELYPDFADAEG